MHLLTGIRPTAYNSCVRHVPSNSWAPCRKQDRTPGWTKKKKNPKHINTVILLGSCSIKQRSSLCRGEAEHTSLSVSTYKRLSFILLKCCLINVLVTLNISTAGGTFVIVEMAGRVGHRWELLPHTGVDIWAAGWTRWARVIDTPACLDLNQREAELTRRTGT